MPTASRLRQKQRDEIHPLIRALIERLGNARSYMEIAQDTGLTNYQVGRLLGEALPSPTYLDVTKLVIAAGMTPNEAAHIVGLYHGPDYDRSAGNALTVDEQRVVDLLRSVKLPEEERGLFRAMLETMLEAFSERLTLKRRRQPSPPSVYDENQVPDWEVREVDRRVKRAKSATTS